MLRKILVLGAIALSWSAASFAQNGQGHFQKSTIAVTIDGFTCNNGQGTIPALSWSFGVTTPESSTTGGGGGSAKAHLSDLSVSRKADACTPTLFAEAVKGSHSKQVTIVEQDAQKDDIFTVTLMDVAISSYQLGGDAGHEVPMEQIGFNYRKICVADTGTGSKSCWDLVTAQSF
jgi:type VI protein secretion system component Hcp